jgi:hypothetical protein
LERPSHCPNAAIREDGHSGEWQDWLVDESRNRETTLAASEEFDKRSGDYSSHQSIGAPHFKELQNPPVHAGTLYLGECRSP